MRILDKILEVRREQRSIVRIIGWWELRRIFYNLVVLVSGIISMSIMSSLIELKPGEDLEEPIVIIGFAFLCNLFYTLGWLTEILRERSLTYAPKMFKRGLYFTLFWVFLPALLHIIFWIFRGFEKAN
jgi:hypothetical protein